MYVDKAISYNSDDHYGFRSLLECSHFDIHTKWVTDLNDQSEMLAFVVNGEEVFAVSNGCMVYWAGYQAMATRVKAECTSAGEQLIVELQNRFPSHNVLNAMEIVYPQYWAQADCMHSFGSHLQILKDFFCDPKDVGRGLDCVVVPGLLSAYDLDYQQSMFKLAMSSNFKAALEPPFTLNPLPMVWRTLVANDVLASRFAEYVKICFKMVLGSVEDERTFSSLAFLKSKLQNALDNHLPLVVGKYSQKMFTLDTFPHDATFEEWMNSPEHCRYGTFV